jgi:peptide/nickel transport system ATP-binding protein
VKPRLLILDEAFAGLDISIQAQIACLLDELQARLDLTYLYVSHDLGLMRVLADEVAIMLEGRIVERGAVRSIFADPRHAHTRALIAAVPSLPAPPAAPAL